MAHPLGSINVINYLRRIGELADKVAQLEAMIYSHAHRHIAGGGDQLFDLSLDQIATGSRIPFSNGWRIEQDDTYGIVIVDPTGKRYRILIEEI